MLKVVKYYVKYDVKVLKINLKLLK